MINQKEPNLGLKKVFLFAVFAVLTSFDGFNFDVKKNINTMPIQFAFNEVVGGFAQVESSIIFNPSNIDDADFEVNIKTQSLNTKWAFQVDHAKGPDWFDAIHYPELIFRGTRVQKIEGGYVVKGLLTIKKESRMVEIPFQYKNDLVIGTFTILRSDFGIGPNNTICATVADKINVQFELEVDDDY